VLAVSMPVAEVFDFLTDPPFHPNFSHNAPVIARACDLTQHNSYFMLAPIIHQRNTIADLNVRAINFQ
jgi:hypothetical protein